MVNEEIKTGLKNALDRGQPPERAVQSLITAGYNAAEVRQAIQELNTSVLHHISEPEQAQTNPIISTSQTQQPIQNSSQIQKLPQQIPLQQNQTQFIEPPRKKKMSRWLLALIIILVIILLLTVSFIFSGKYLLEMLFPKV